MNDKDTSLVDTLLSLIGIKSVDTETKKEEKVNESHNYNTLVDSFIREIYSQ